MLCDELMTIITRSRIGKRLDTLIGDLINEPELLIEMKGLNQGSSEEREEDERG